jgi:uncharacterized Ntn-hydrolase superfamily protein
MTFSLLGRCAQTGQLGGVVTTSDLAVGARVLWAVAGLGVVATQQRTDPRLGPELLDSLGAGLDAGAAVATVIERHPDRAWRQLGVLDGGGRTAYHTGARAWPFAGAAAGDGCLALGNMLVGEHVLGAMVDGFAGADGELAARLLAAVLAGAHAGGETGELQSAALLVVERESFPLVDLRVDLASDPLAALESLWTAYQPWVREFVTRALDPDHAGGSSPGTPALDRGRAHGSSSTTT